MTNNAGAEIGQVWRRKKDGVRVILERHDALADDWYWAQVNDRTKRGVIFGWNLKERYELESGGVTDFDLAWERWAKDYAGTHPDLDRFAFRAGWEARTTTI